LFFVFMKQLLFVLIIAIVLGSCQSGKKPNDTAKKPVILVSILPQKTFVEKIAGDDFEVVVLVPPGASSEAFTLIPSQLKDIAVSVAWFRIGYIGFELSWKDKIFEANKTMKIYDLSEGLNLVSEKTILGNGQEIETGVDPHIWLSPALVKEMALKIKNILTEINPSGRQKYMERCQDYIEEISQTDIEIRKELSGFEGRTIIVFHPSLTYFARDFGLNQVSLESGGKEPTPRHIRQVVDLAKKEKIKVIYIQSELDQEHARLMAEEIGGKIIRIFPLSPDWNNNLISIARTISNNFK